MTSTRTYRKAGSVEGALDELARHAGRQFDPDIVEALRRAVSKGKLKLLSQPPLTKAQMDALAVAEEAAAANS